MSPIKKWRVNYIITYADTGGMLLYRALILDTLKNLARIKEIDCAISYEHLFVFETPLYPDNIYSQAIVDLVYFRSLPHTGISAKEFRKLVDSVFSNQLCLGLGGHYEVEAQPQKLLSKFPFPK